MAQSQRTLWFDRLHSEKPTTIYNLMSHNVRSGAITALRSSSGPCEKTKDGLVRTLASVTTTWIRVKCVALAKSALEPGEMRKISSSQPTNDRMQVKFGTSWILRYNSVRVHGGDKSGYGTEQGGSCGAETE
ncbi:hypothetical protein AMECASPLE_022771 [Ameca splendens]|uniref:Uncharacterized protein n=1 Tax=Ameca splendens TaxID=208324 RepID=A0ABV0ZCS0_9TELE